MISVIKPKKIDYNFIYEKLKKEKIEFDINENFLVVYDKDDILGFGGYSQINDISNVEVLKVFDDNVLIKDILLKSIFNLADLEGSRYITIKKEDANELKQTMNFKQEHFNKEKDLVCVDLVEFFSGKFGCSGCSGACSHCR